MKDRLLKPNPNPNFIPLSPNLLSSLPKNILTEKGRLKKDTSNCPEYPSWVQDRLYLSWDFYPNPEKFESVSISALFFVVLLTLNSTIKKIRILKFTSCL
jgi:hypothetical protein